MYVDESGDHAYGHLDQPWHRHLAIIGLWFRLADEYIEFEAQLNRLKRDVFGVLPDDHLVLHLSDIKGRRGVFGCLNEPETDRKFCERFLRLITDSRFTMVTAIIDKKLHQERYSYPMHPYHYSMMAICERYAFWLRERATRGDAMVESRGKTEDAELSQQFTNVVTTGTGFLKATQAQSAFSSKELKVRKKSDDIAGLQLADLLAHPMKREALVERELCPDRGGFAREVAAVARSKYRDYYDGRVSGRGRVWI